MKNLKNIQLHDNFLKNDIFGYGEYESIKTDILLDGIPKNYNNVVKLFEIKNIDILYEESIEHIKLIGEKYVKERVLNLPENTTKEDLKDVLTEVGFVIGTYQGYGLRKLGTNELLDVILPETRKLLTKFPVKIYRQQYAIAFNDWNVKYHIDHDNYNIHGFRCMIPLNNNVNIVFRENNQNILYVLKPGFAYFVNIGNTHRAFHYGEVDRMNLMFQMNSDKLILEGEKLKNSSWDNIPEKYKNYNIFSEIMNYNID